MLLHEGVLWLRQPNWWRVIRTALAVALVAVVYVGSFAAHFALAHRSGPDDHVMSVRFQATLHGNPHASNPALQPLGFGEKFAELHQRMFENTRKTLGPHAYASRWYDWPFMMRSVDFWAEAKDGPAGRQIAHVYFLGNPLIWWTAGYCMLYLLVNFPPRLFAWWAGSRAQPPERTETILVIAYLANMLPFVAIGRILFLYHYLPALCVALLGVGHLLDRTGAYRRPLGIGLVVLAAASFAYFAPLSYGLPLTPNELDQRFWVRGWR
jgi:dolichyl-phosphate-mannose-protein mannosyltransferase